ncbi:phosphotransferase [Cohnella boryungensis]|uniref:Phosphotransferase n=2 Tax=Cohnella boryungensis TaxID=768479 RepID=A0ABV8SBA1_9BACL
MKLLIQNNTRLSIENKENQLYACFQNIFGKIAIELVTITCDDLGYKTPNFTTSGIFHLHGTIRIKNEQLPWSIILKVIKSDSTETEDPQHHNYWRREALVFGSKLLDDLPDAVQAAKGYLVEEQQDGTIWLWMEHVKGQYANSQEQFDFIARQLGRFNGAYLMGKEIPNQKWICKGWLKSWTTACQMYAPNPEDYINHLHRDIESRIWAWFQGFNEQIENNLSSLGNLPRVLAHQDLSQMNMLIVKNDLKIDRLVLIDWQFMSISGVGEDLAKMFGVNMSLGIIPPDLYKACQASLFNAYIAGLKDMGWKGDERQARYGYCLGTALRSVWEVPKYISLVAQLENDHLNKNLQDRVTQLEKIIKVQMEMALEADTLKALKI